VPLGGVLAAIYQAVGMGGAQNLKARQIAYLDAKKRLTVLPRNLLDFRPRFVS
jgi:hypothetical protein